MTNEINSSSIIVKEVGFSLFALSTIVEEIPNELRYLPVPSVV